MTSTSYAIPTADTRGDRESELELMAWATPLYSRSRVDKAGMTVVSSIRGEVELDEAYAIINNWRASHNYPLNTFQITLRNRASRVASDYIVAQRIKRLESLCAKLERAETNKLQLSRMQDIGGCRAVLRTINQVNKLVSIYKNSDFSHEMQGEKNYLNNPKDDGYRGVHLVYKYKGKGPTEVYDNLRIEVQIRTIQQHAWATAVEAVSIFTDQALKWRAGQRDWQRFFALMGPAIAMIEDTSPVPNTPTDYAALRDELRSLVESIGVVDVLQMYKTTIQYVGERKDAKYLLLELDPEKKDVKINRFTASASQEANARYMEAERRLPQGAAKQVVLVSVDSFSKLQRAYPNYFMDTTMFSNIVSQFISDPSGRFYRETAA